MTLNPPEISFFQQYSGFDADDQTETNLGLEPSSSVEVFGTLEESIIFGRDRFVCTL